MLSRREPCITRYSRRRLRLALDRGTAGDTIPPSTATPEAGVLLSVSPSVALRHRLPSSCHRAAGQGHRLGNICPHYSARASAAGGEHGTRQGPQAAQRSRAERSNPTPTTPRGLRGSATGPQPYPRRGAQAACPSPSLTVIVSAFRGEGGPPRRRRGERCRGGGRATARGRATSSGDPPTKRSGSSQGGRRRRAARPSSELISSACSLLDAAGSIGRAQFALRRQAGQGARAAPAPAARAGYRCRTLTERRGHGPRRERPRAKQARATQRREGGGGSRADQHRGGRSVAAECRPGSGAAERSRAARPVGYGLFAAVTGHRRSRSAAPAACLTL